MKARIDRRRSRTFRGFNRLLKLVLGAYLRLRFDIHPRSLNAFNGIRPPYLILATHVGYWDPFVISILTDDPVHWVAADQTFRSPLQGYLLQFVGAIPKTKGVSDFETIREILRIRRNAGVIGVFPEGQRTWDGVTLPLLPATAKLVKLLKVPVITARFKGAYFAHPRWARSPRRGKLLVEFHHAFDPAEVRALSTEEIYRKLQSLLEHDDYQFQTSRMIPYRGARRAEYIENVLFSCPVCRAVDSIRSHRDMFTCSSCGTTWDYTAEGFLHAHGGVPTHTTVRDWNEWQLAELQRRLQGAVDAAPSTGEAAGSAAKDSGAARPAAAGESASAPLGREGAAARPAAAATRAGAASARAAAGTDEAAARPGRERAAALPEHPIFEEHGIVVHTGFRSARVRRVGTGILRLFPDRITFSDPGGTEHVFHLAGVDGINIQLVRKLELYSEEALYTFDPLSPRVNMYKWYMALEYLAAMEGLEMRVPEGGV